MLPRRYWQDMTTAEFAAADTPVLFVGGAGGSREAALGDLLPFDSLHDLAHQ